MILLNSHKSAYQVSDTVLSALVLNSGSPYNNPMKQGAIISIFQMRTPDPEQLGNLGKVIKLISSGVRI